MVVVGQNRDVHPGSVPPSTLTASPAGSPAGCTCSLQLASSVIINEEQYIYEPVSLAGVCNPTWPLRARCWEPTVSIERERDRERETERERERWRPSALVYINYIHTKVIWVLCYVKPASGGFTQLHLSTNLRYLYFTWVFFFSWYVILLLH